MLLKTRSRFNPRGRHIYEFGVWIDQIQSTGNFNIYQQYIDRLLVLLSNKSLLFVPALLFRFCLGKNGT